MKEGDWEMRDSWALAPQKDYVWIFKFKFKSLKAA